MTSGSLVFLKKLKIPKTMGIRRRFGQYWSEFCQKMSNNFRSSDSDFFDVAAAGAAILSGRKSHFSTAVMAVFLYANSASRHDLHTVQSHLDAGIVVPPTHGNVSSTAWHAVSEADTVKVRDFIQHYASVHGLTQPAAPRGHNMPAPTYLPSSCTKLLVHALYVKAGGSVSYQT